MSDLRKVRDDAGLWRWICDACGEESHRSFLTEAEATLAARGHLADVHPDSQRPDDPLSARA